ncbi:MAG: GCN5-related N-acetyltransferase [Chloroflexi bacterium]|nr:GCN5-related N-acetyltransferase [Chloroflexota bacterium]
MSPKSPPDPSPGYARPVTPATLAEIERLADLLAGADLPRAGFDAVLAAGDVLVARDTRGRAIGCAAMERHGAAVLLRSVAVDPAWRGHGLGRRLVDTVLARARSSGAREAYLLTETAAGFFDRLGWERCSRSDVPPAVAGSVEFTSACPLSAVAMRRAI